MTAYLVGNATVRQSNKNRVEDLPPGFDMFSLYGTARLSTTAANNWDILDDKDLPLTVPATVGDPSWLLAVTAKILPGVGQTISGTNGDILKVGTSVADVTFVANSAAIAGALLAAQDIRSTQAPYAVTQITANALYRLFLHVANAAPGGNLTIVQAAGTRAPNFLRVPVEILYLKRSPAVRIEEVPSLSVAQQRLDGGIT